MKKIIFGILAVLIAAPVIASEVATTETETETNATESAVVEREKNARQNNSRENKSTAALRIGMMPNTAAVRSSSEILPATQLIIETDPDLECGIGEYPSGASCVQCAQKNNPGVRWANPGVDCQISECVSDEYMFVDGDNNAQKCLSKCDIWGGVASREWNRETASFSFCGSGKAIECGAGFVKTNDRTNSSGTKFWHCVPDGIMTGVCTESGRINIGKFTGGQCIQTCENGYWSNCTISKFCEAGFAESNYKDVITIIGGADSTIAAYDCVSQ
jgi:hypothetical protein